MRKTVILDEKAMERAITRIAHEIVERNKGIDDVCIIGVLSRGAQLGKSIAQKIEQIEQMPIAFGILDSTPFRDDIQCTKKMQDRSNIEFKIENKRVILVDDVLYTGRTTRCAIDALLARGRVGSVQLAVLIDRGHRELPFRADFVGKNLPTARQEMVRVEMREQDGRDCVTVQSPF